jgi:hypothetical protein
MQGFQEAALFHFDGYFLQDETVKRYTSMLCGYTIGHIEPDIADFIKGAILCVDEHMHAVSNSI